MKKQLINYFKSLGIEVYTNTKARGHQGFFLKNRIDISKNIKEERIIPTLLHEFTHYIHAKIEPDMPKTGGSLEKIFNLGKMDFELNQTLLEGELLAITRFVDEHSQCNKLLMHKQQVKHKIKEYENIIKKDYPNFLRSKKFKEFDKYIKKSKARYLLKFDRIKFVSPSFLGLMKKIEIFTIENIEKDFPEIPEAFCSYIRLKSAQKKQTRISARINKLNKYYTKPSELFARLVEGIYLDTEYCLKNAPYAIQKFFELLNSGYYQELKEVLCLHLQIVPEQGATASRQACFFGISNTKG